MIMKNNIGMASWTIPYIPSAILNTSIPTTIPTENIYKTTAQVYFLDFFFSYLKVLEF